MFVFDIEAFSINTTSMTTTWADVNGTVSGYTHTEKSKVENEWNTRAEDPIRNGTTGFNPTTSNTSFVPSETVAGTSRDSVAINDTGKMSLQE